MRTTSLAAIILLAVTACSGEQGTPGASGTSQLLRTTIEAPGTHCPSGGTRVETGLDDNGNQALDAAEVDSTVYVCNGADGQPVAATPEAAGANCPQGGVKVTPPGGAPTYVCSGAPGATGAGRRERHGDARAGGDQLRVRRGAAPGGRRHPDLRLPRRAGRDRSWPGRASP